MKNVSSQLRAAIDDGVIAVLFSIVAEATNKEAYYTTHSSNIVYGGHTYTPLAGIERLQMNLTNSAEVSEQEIISAVVGIPDEELEAGLWDYAEVKTYLYGWQMATPEAMLLTSGTIGQISWTEDSFRAVIQSFARDLNKTIGHLVMPTCRHQLYDIGIGRGALSSCGVDPAAYTQSATVSYILTTRRKVKIATTGKPDGWGTRGYAVWLTGANAGMTTPVKIHEVNPDTNIGESVEFQMPTGLTIQVGDTFNLLAGCDKTIGAGGCAKFNNIVRFGGFPHLQPDVNVNATLT